MNERDDKMFNIIQEALSATDDGGWSCAHYVVCVGLERFNSDGEIESAAWWHNMPNQAEYVTDGLLRRIAVMRECADYVAGDE